MKTQITILTIVLILLAGALVFSAIQIINASEKNKDENTKRYSYTTAICNDTNLCQDHIVECNGTKLLSTTPITGAVVQKPLDWQDPRSKEITNEFCNL